MHAIHMLQAMANMQIKVATDLGDPRLACKCRINLAYNDIQVIASQQHSLLFRSYSSNYLLCRATQQNGKFRCAKAKIVTQTTVANELEDEELIAMTTAAALYLKKAKQAHKVGLLDPDAAVNPTRDEFYRMRLA